MRVRRLLWGGAAPTAALAREWMLEEEDPVEIPIAVREIAGKVLEAGDDALLALTAEIDGVELAPDSLRIDASAARAALEDTAKPLREAMELAADNIRTVAEAQLGDGAEQEVALPQGQTVRFREVAVGSAGIYAPGGRASYPSSVLMSALPARVAGVERLALASPPGPDGLPSAPVLAAAALCGIEEIYALGGAQAIFALAFGTETVGRVDVVVGPGNRWVQEAKRRAFGEVGLDSYAGPSELMVIAGHDVDVDWLALDLCAQAEHGAESPLLVATVEERVLDEIEAAVTRAAGSRPSVADAPLALVQVPDAEAAIDLANAFAPEHLELMEEDASLLADRIATAGCVFVGRSSATAFGDYAAGSNHVLPTSGAGRFSGPLGPGTFRRKISTVEIPADAAAKLAPHVDAIARAEGFPVHGESAMIRAEEND